MRRLPLIVSFLLFLALCASAAYWAMQLFKPPLRPVAAPPQAMQAEIHPEAAASLFGAPKGIAAAASNYQLRGVIFSGNPRDSVAILSADGKPPQAIRAETEVTPGVTIKEVHRDHVLLTEGGVTKRVDMPESTKGMEGLAVSPAATRPATPPVPVAGQPVPSRAQAAAAAQAGQPPLPGVPSLPAAPTAPQAVPGVPAQPQVVQPPTQAMPGLSPAPASTMAPPATVLSPVPGAAGTAAPAAPPPPAVPGAQ